MPIYEYQCADCKHHFDLLQKVQDNPIETCPQCHKNTVTKLVSAAGFQLKGTGWYVTDFKNKPKATAEKSTTHADSPAKETAAVTTTADGKDDGH
jgi:putative FmdB family regulatory protein